MRPRDLLLVGSIAALQFPLWFGDGGWIRIIRMQSTVATIEQQNQEKISVNQTLQAAVNELRNGGTVLEEEARYQLGLIKKEEVFVHLIDGQFDNQAPLETSGTIVTAPRALPGN